VFQIELTRKQKKMKVIEMKATGDLCMLEQKCYKRARAITHKFYWRLL